MVIFETEIFVEAIKSDFNFEECICFELLVDFKILKSVP